MCGIFGLVTNKNYNNFFLESTLKKVALLSESRGKESSGFVFRNCLSKSFTVLKGPLTVSEQLKKNLFKEKLADSFTNHNSKAVIGHSRLVTNGTMLNNINNQPVVKDGIIGVHNGIVINHKSLWDNLTNSYPTSDLDTEVLMALFAYYINHHEHLDDAIRQVLSLAFGTVSVAFFVQELSVLALTTNNGSLYYLTNHNDFLVFASERYILNTLAENLKFENHIGKYTIQQILPFEGIIIDLNIFNIFKFGESKDNKQFISRNNSFSVNYIEFDSISKKQDTLIDIRTIQIDKKSRRERHLLEFNTDSTKKLLRCKKCLLPSTFPYISFDLNGICNICLNYKLQNQPKPFSLLANLIEPYRRPNKEIDCIVPFSGGRDSSYTLHILKTELGLNPITLTYDWGMVTDLARRNIARVCGKLGVENIVVSADINIKRRNIRKNVLSWLRKPDLGMVPLFMAGDKAFFYYVRQLQLQTNVNLNIWGINRLENTDFKVGFCGVPPDFSKENIYTLKAASALKLGWHVLFNFLTNPSYINESLSDNLQASISRYLPKTDYYNFFDFRVWDEHEVNRTIIDNYDWEQAIDTSNTWRVGDGTAAFYNYIYYTVAGFSEFDTFRSNQIREGMITREQGLVLIEQDNRPRYESLRWYLDIIGLDFENTIRQINHIPKLYSI